MKAHNLLLARKYTERPEHVHDGKVIVMRANLRWCSDGFEFTCWSGDIVRGAFIIDARDREIIAWRAFYREGHANLRPPVGPRTLFYTGSEPTE